MKKSIEGLTESSRELTREAGFFFGGGSTLMGPSAKSQREKFLSSAVNILIAAETADDVIKIFNIINKAGFMHVAGSLKGIQDHNFKHIVKGGEIVRYYGVTSSIMHLIGVFCSEKLKYIHQKNPKDISGLSSVFTKLRIKLQKDYKIVNSEAVLESWKQWNLKFASEEKLARFLPHPPVMPRPFLGTDDWEMVEVIDEPDMKIELAKTVLHEIKISGKDQDKLRVVKNMENKVITDINTYFLENEKITDLASAVKIFGSMLQYKYNEIMGVCKQIQRLTYSIPNQSLREVQKETRKIEKIWEDVSSRLIVELFKNSPEEKQSEDGESTSSQSSSGRLSIPRSLSFSSGVSPFAFLPHSIKQKIGLEDSSQKNRGFSFES